MMGLSDEIRIHEFSAEYQEEILNLIVTIQQTEFEIAITAEDQPDLCNIRDFYQKNTGNFWVALFNNKVIGTISLLDIGNGRAALRKMFVDKAYRGERYQVASRLLDTLIKWAESKKIKEVYLGTTSKFLAAHRFYEKSGFWKIDKSALPGTFPVMKVDTRFYKFKLS